MNNDVAQQEQQFLEMMLAEHRRKENNFKELNKDAVKGGICFVGDSITEGYPVHELIKSHLPIYNRGISGYKAYQLKETIDEITIPLNPSVIFLLIGTNDIADEKTNTEIVDSMQVITSKLEKSLPQTKVFVLSILPVYEDVKFAFGVHIRTNKIINELNEMIKDFIKQKPYLTYLDANKAMLKGNQMNEDYTFDGLHLTISGYKQLSNFLGKYCI